MTAQDSDTTTTHSAATAGPAEPTQPAERQLPRALTPFRGSAYRRLAIALVFSTFAGGIWVVAQVWEVVRLGGGASQLSVVATASALGVILPALLAGVVADRIPQKRILLVVAGIELLCMASVATLSLLDLT
ncbi:MAG TPA: MFS transporter, partial [Nocardioides sp.]